MPAGFYGTAPDCPLARIPDMRQIQVISLLRQDLKETRQRVLILTPMIGKYLTPILLLSLGAATASHAGLTVAGAFSDHAVLQREIAVPVWGTADPGSKVTVKFQAQTKTVVAGKDGHWRLSLDPLKAGGAETMTIAVRFACSKKRSWANLFNKDGLPALAFRTDDW